MPLVTLRNSTDAAEARRERKRKDRILGWAAGDG
jgi:hypothetical protein